MSVYWIIIVVQALICALLSGMIANSKGNNGIGWMFAGLLFGVLGLLAAGFTPDAARRAEIEKLRS